VEGSCEHSNEPSGSIKCWEILEWLHNWWLLKKGSVLIFGMFPYLFILIFSKEIQGMEGREPPSPLPARGIHHRNNTVTYFVMIEIYVIIFFQITVAPARVCLDNYSSLCYYFSKHYDVGITAHINCLILQTLLELQPRII
jgi:hypothetical protein